MVGSGCVGVGEPPQPARGRAVMNPMVVKKAYIKDNQRPLSGERQVWEAIT